MSYFKNKIEEKKIIKEEQPLLKNILDINLRMNYFLKY